MSNLDVGVKQSGSGLDVGVLQSIGLTPLNESFNDTLSLSDTLGLGLGLVVVGDQFSFTDVVSVTPPATGILINDASYVNVLSDTQDYCLGLFPQYSDTFTFADSLGLTLGLQDFSDALSFTDSFSMSSGVTPIFSDDFAFSDAVTIGILGQLSETISDSLSLSDSVIDNRVGIINITKAGQVGLSPDGIALGDTFSKLMTMALVMPSDILSLSDSISVFLVIPQSFNEFFEDTLSFSDTQSFSSAYFPQLNDSLDLEDSIQLLLLPLGLQLSLGDSQIYNDAVQLLMVGFEAIASFQDELILTDNVQIQLTQSFTSYIRRYLNDV